MHELSIAISLLDLAEEQCAKHGGTGVATIHLKLGPLAGVVKEALESAYNLARECTPLKDCKLLIEDVPIIAFCARCKAEKMIESPQMLCCPTCGSPTPDIRKGRELEIFAMEICQ